MGTQYKKLGARIELLAKNFAISREKIQNLLLIKLYVFKNCSCVFGSAVFKRLLVKAHYFV